MNSLRLLAGIALAGSLAGAAAAAPARYTTGSDQTYVHRINLIDAGGNLVGPDSKVPYSPAKTCGKCHDVERIAMGRHFQAGFGGLVDGRPGEPWVLWDAATGTQVPLSYRDWAIGARRRPSDFGMTDWEFALVFGRHHPGGGMLQWLREGRPRESLEESFLALPEVGRDAPKGTPVTAPDLPEPRWKQVGGVEVDCLACHANGGYSNGNRWYYMHQELNFRGAPTAAAGFGTIRTNEKDAMRLERGYLADTPQWSPYLPKGAGVQYDPARFDPDGRVFVDVTRRPPARNCQYCHASRVPGVTDTTEPDRDLDVHLAAGLACTDCHRNGIDHEIARGDGGGEARSFHPGSETLTCRGCHESGRLGAPVIRHYGLPTFHLERLSCTACHAGPKPTREVGLTQTARIHGLGLKSFRNYDALQRPAVQAPIYKRDDDGVIRPHAGIWPAWYGVRKDGALVPIPVQQARAAINIVRPALAELEQLEAQKTGERNWVEAKKRENIKTTPEETLVAGRNYLIVWQENQGKEKIAAEEKAFQEAVEEARKKTAVTGGRILEEDLRNALDNARAGLAMRKDEEQRKRELPLVLKCLALKEKSVKDQKDLYSLLVPVAPPEKLGQDGKPREKTLDERIQENLATLLGDFKQESSFVYVAGGKIFQADGKVVDNAPEAVPYLWPIAHNVRGAGEALGAKGCSDCHALRAPFFFGVVKAQPAGPGGDGMAIKQCTLMRLSGNAIRIGAAAVVMREGAMKRIGLLVILGLLGLSFVHYVLVVRGAAAADAAVSPNPFGAGPVPGGMPWTSFCALALAVVLCATGAGFLSTYGPSPIFEIFTAPGTVKLHLVGGLVFAACVAVLAVRWAVLVVSRDLSLRGMSGGFLWMGRAADESPLLAKARCGTCWIWLDLLCCIAVAGTGIIMAGRNPSIGHALHILERLADHRFIGPLAYAIHGAAGSALIARLLGHLYARFILRGRT